MLRPVVGHRIMLTPDAVLRGETVDDILERVVSRIKPPLGVGRGPLAAATEARVPSAPADNGKSNGRSRNGRVTRGRGAQAKPAEAEERVKATTGS